MNGYEAIHWMKIGVPNAPDKIIFEYARAHGFIVFTHDLDFGAILVATNADAPSVFQIRTQDLTPQHIGKKNNLLFKQVYSPTTCRLHAYPR